MTRRPIEAMPLTGSRLFADGLASWLIRRLSGDDEWAVFDRPAGSERDLVVLAETMGATIVQRHPNGSVRIVGEHRRAAVGRPDVAPRAADLVVDRRRDGVRDLRRRATCCELLLEFAVHDLGARGIGAILLFRPDNAGPSDDRGAAAHAAAARHHAARPTWRRCATPCPDRRRRRARRATGILRELGVRLVPSPEAETSVEGLRGMRHTSGRRYSFDDPRSTVIVVSEDGPVTVLRNGEVLGHSR